MLVITLASSTEKIDLIKSTFQPLRSLSSNATTEESATIILGGEWTKKEIGVDNHLSPQILMLCPSPTLHSSPWYKKSLPEKKLHQAKECCIPREESIKEELGSIWL
jgi:hypothetical protein